MSTSSKTHKYLNAHNVFNVNMACYTFTLHFEMIKSDLKQLSFFYNCLFFLYLGHLHISLLTKKVYVFK